MRIHIQDDIYISSSAGGLGFTVDKLVMVNVKGQEEKEESYKTVAGGNYTSLSGAINGVLKLKVTESNATTLTELAARIKQWREELTALVTI